MTLTPEDIAAGWVEWGGEPRGLVEVRDGHGNQCTAPANCLYWGHDPKDPGNDIQSYRIVQPAPENGSE